MIQSNRLLAIVFAFTLSFLIYSQVVLWGEFLRGQPALKNESQCLSAIKQQPIDAANYMALGFIYNKSGKRDMAKIQLGRALRLAPSDADNYFMAGKMFIQMGDKKSAYESFKESIRLSDRHELDILNSIFESSGQLPELEKVVPDDARSKFIFSKFLDKKNMWDQAKSEFSAVMVMPVKLPAYYYKYFIYRSKARKDYDYILAIADRYICNKSEDIFILRELGYAYLNKGDYAKAENIYIKGLTIDKEDIEILDYLGQVYLKEKGAQAAISYYEDVIFKHRPDASTHFFLGKAYYTEKKYESALKNFKKSLQMDPKNIWARCSLGLAYFYLGKSGQAILEYKECLKMQPDNFYALKYLAQAFEQGNNIEEALASYKKASQVNPEDEFTKSAIMRIESQKLK